MNSAMVRSVKVNTHRINLWLPSMCHKLLGAGTLYCRRLAVWIDSLRIKDPSGSTRRNDACKRCSDKEREISFLKSCYNYSAIHSSL